MTIARPESELGATAEAGRVASGDTLPSRARRRGYRWSPAERRALADLSRQPGGSVSEVAQTFGISRETLYDWRRRYAAVEPSPVVGTPAVFARVEVCELAPAGELMADCSPAEGVGRIVVDFPSGVRVRLDGVVDPMTLEVVLAELGR